MVVTKLVCIQYAYTQVSIELSKVNASSDNSCTVRIMGCARGLGLGEKNVQDKSLLKLSSQTFKYKNNYI